MNLLLIMCNQVDIVCKNSIKKLKAKKLKAKSWQISIFFLLFNPFKPVNNSLYL